MKESVWKFAAVCGALALVPSAVFAQVTLPTADVGVDTAGLMTAGATEIGTLIVAAVGLFMVVYSIKLGLRWFSKGINGRTG